MITKKIFNFVKSKIPRISSTEMIALKSGSTSIDRSILSGKLEYPNEKKFNNKFQKKKLVDLFKNFDNSNIYPNNNQNYWINYLGKNKFFSFLIDEKYGGIKLSVNELSNILTNISSFNPSLGVVTMVPNSLGPGELLTHYGTEDQKKKYLTGLANGSYIPCFGLTGPENGSDATGNIDSGVVIKENDNIYIDINLNKRYITLAPVANLLGIAFDLKDPENILGKSGISLALIERDHINLIQDSHHNPLNIGFPNGTIKGNIKIDIDQIIGGYDNIGNGWKMLMECLSAGRGISLPATANASSKIASVGILNYIKVRDQFGLKLENMEAIQEKVNKIIINTWIIQSSIKMTNDILDSGQSPSVISAIMKQQCTERGRIVINEAMDIHAGASICVGYNNFLEKFYKCIPVGITVEGSNTLTRSLIIFAQGLNKSHPYIFPVLENVLNNDLNNFKHNFNNLIYHSVSLYFKSFSFNNNLEQQIINYANLVNFISLKGGKLKKEQMLSGDMADIFSNLYLAQSVIYYNNLYKSSNILTEYIVDSLINNNQIKINKIINNLDSSRFLLQHLKKPIKPIYYKNELKLFNEINNNENIMNELLKNIYVDSGILSDLIKINKIDKNSNEYKILKDKIINVDEYNNNFNKELYNHENSINLNNVDNNSSNDSIKKLNKYQHLIGSAESHY